MYIETGSSSSTCCCCYYYLIGKCLRSTLIYHNAIIDGYFVSLGGGGMYNIFDDIL